MTDQIKTVNVYDEARKALAEITAIEGVTEGPWTWRNDDIAAQHIAACDPATMQAIAALVSAQDARIDARDAQIATLHYAALALLESDENTGGNAGQMFYDALDKALIDTAATATAYEARIRADERERCAKVADRAHGGPVGASGGDTVMAGTNHAAAAAIRARGGSQ